MLSISVFTNCISINNLYINRCPPAPFFNDKFLKEKGVTKGHLLTQVTRPRAFRIRTQTYISLTLESNCLTLQNIPLRFLNLLWAYKNFPLNTSFYQDDVFSPPVWKMRPPVCSLLPTSPLTVYFSLLHFSLTSWHITHFIYWLQSTSLHCAGRSIKPGVWCCQDWGSLPINYTVPAVGNRDLPTSDYVAPGQLWWPYTWSKISQCFVCSSLQVGIKINTDMIGSR